MRLHFKIKLTATEPQKAVGFAVLFSQNVRISQTLNAQKSCELEEGVSVIYYSNGPLREEL
jgi:hypothetical protein